MEAFVRGSNRVAVLLCEGQKVKRDSMPANPEILLKYLKNIFSGATIHTAYEAAFSVFHLHSYSVSQGIKNIVVHPGSM